MKTTVSYNAGTKTPGGYAYDVRNFEESRDAWFWLLDTRTDDLWAAGVANDRDACRNKLLHLAEISNGVGAVEGLDPESKDRIVYFVEEAQ